VAELDRLVPTIKTLLDRFGKLVHYEHTRRYTQLPGSVEQVVYQQGKFALRVTPPEPAESFITSENITVSRWKTYASPQDFENPLLLTTIDQLGPGGIPIPFFPIIPNRGDRIWWGNVHVATQPFVMTVVEIERIFTGDLIGLYGFTLEA
jgi:hypothetical protein